LGLVALKLEKLLALNPIQLPVLTRGLLRLGLQAFLLWLLVVVVGKKWGAFVFAVEALEMLAAAAAGV
jgi:hypothetical protein